MLKLANVSNHNASLKLMQNHKTKIGNNTIWVGLLLGLLLIISPCSVQNILQNDFSVKTTKRLIAVNQRFRPILIVAFNMTSLAYKRKKQQKIF
jgi:cytochrome c biogenesis protein CcdA